MNVLLSFLSSFYQTCELELDSFRAKNATLMTHLGEIQRRLLTWGLNPKVSIISYPVLEST